MDKSPSSKEVIREGPASQVQRDGSAPGVSVWGEVLLVGDGQGMCKRSGETTSMWKGPVAGKSMVSWEAHHLLELGDQAL